MYHLLLYIPHKKNCYRKMHAKISTKYILFKYKIEYVTFKN